MKKKYIFTGIYCLSLCPLMLMAQSGVNSNNDVAIQKTAALFYSTINDNAVLYNGSEYIMYDPRVKGTPYFMDGDMQPADILCNGTLYNKVPLLYEITTGNVIVRQFGNGVLIDLINEKIGFFTLLGHTFIHLVPDSTDKIISNGFYDRIYNGITTVYASRKKIVYEEPNTFEKSFVEKDHYFIYRNNTYYEVNDRGSVLDVFKDRKKELVKYLRQNDIKFRKQPEYAMVKMAEYYDKLTH